MAQKMTVALEDVLDGRPADETVRFAIGGSDYDIDLSAQNAAAFHRQLARFIDHARRAGRGRCVPHPAGSAVPTSGRGPKARASRSANAGASLSASSRGTKPPPAYPDPHQPLLVGPASPPPGLALTVGSGAASRAQAQATLA